jgi:hypothetical protein
VDVPTVKYLNLILKNQQFADLLLFAYCHCRSYYQEVMVGVPFTGLCLPHFCACPNTGSGFPMPYGFFWGGGSKLKQSVEKRNNVNTT